MEGMPRGVLLHVVAFLQRLPHSCRLTAVGKLSLTFLHIRDHYATIQLQAVSKSVGWLFCLFEPSLENAR